MLIRWLGLCSSAIASATFQLSDEKLLLRAVGGGRWPAAISATYHIQGHQPAPEAFATETCDEDVGLRTRMRLDAGSLKEGGLGCCTGHAKQGLSRVVVPGSCSPICEGAQDFDFGRQDLHRLRSEAQCLPSYPKCSPKKSKERHSESHRCTLMQVGKHKHRAETDQGPGTIT